MGWMIVFIVFMSAMHKIDGDKTPDCVSSPVQYGHLVVLAFSLPKDYAKETRPIYIKWRAFDKAGFEHVLSFEWDTETKKYEIQTDIKDYNSGGIHDFTLFVIVRNATAAHTGEYQLETNKPAHTWNCKLKEDRSVKAVQLTLNSESRFLEVNEGQSVNFKCSVKADRPRLNLILVKNHDLEIIHGKQSPLTYNMSQVQCEDNAVYVCFAKDGDVTRFADSADLRVSCDMQVENGSFSPSSKDGAPPVLGVVEGKGKLTFNIISRETPKTSEFRFLGSDTEGTGSPAKAGRFSGECEERAAMYRSKCTITASGVAKEMYGCYKVLIKTATERIDVMFSVRDIQPKTPKRCEDDDPNAYVLPSIIGTNLFCLTAIVVLVVIVDYLYRAGKFQREGCCKLPKPNLEALQQEHKRNDEPESMGMVPEP